METRSLDCRPALSELSFRERGAGAGGGTGGHRHRVKRASLVCIKLTSIHSSTLVHLFDRHGHAIACCIVEGKGLTQCCCSRPEAPALHRRRRRHRRRPLWRLSPSPSSGPGSLLPRLWEQLRWHLRNEAEFRVFNEHGYVNRYTLRCSKCETLITFTRPAGGATYYCCPASGRFCQWGECPNQN